MSLAYPITKGRRGDKLLFGYNNDCQSTANENELIFSLLEPEKRLACLPRLWMVTQSQRGWRARAQRPAKRISPTTSERSGPAVVTVIDSDPPAVQGPEDG